MTMTMTPEQKGQLLRLASSPHTLDAARAIAQADWVDDETRAEVQKRIETTRYGTFKNYMKNYFKHEKTWNPDGSPALPSNTRETSRKTIINSK